MAITFTRPTLQVLIPFAYLALLLIPLVVFSRIYRRRTASSAQSLLLSSPWFPPHLERSIYITLLQQDAPPADDLLLKAALLRRAVTDVKRIWRMRDDKAALGILIQKGQVGDDLLVQLQQAEKELEAEIIEVVSEANTFREGWGQAIFQTASEIAQHDKLKEVYHGIATVREEEAVKLPFSPSNHALPDAPSFTSHSASNSTLSAAEPSSETFPSVSTPPGSPPSSISKGSAKKANKKRK